MVDRIQLDSQGEEIDLEAARAKKVETKADFAAGSGAAAQINENQKWNGKIQQGALEGLQAQIADAQAGIQQFSQKLEVYEDAVQSGKILPQKELEAIGHKFRDIAIAWDRFGQDINDPRLVFLRDRVQEVQRTGRENLRTVRR